MRTLLKVSLAVQPANRGIKDGSLPKTLQSVMAELKPEASYFYAENGKRTALFVFDMKDSSQIPSVVETFFMGFDAEVALTPVMNADDLKTGLDKLIKKL